jgi:hypothetical protein
VKQMEISNFCSTKTNHLMDFTSKQSAFTLKDS